MKKQRNNKPNFWMYLKKYKLQIAIYILAALISSGIGIFLTIVFARAIEYIALPGHEDHMKAIYCGLICVGLTIIQRMFWWLTSYLYDKYSSKMMAELNLVLAKQAFLLNSKTYSDHGTGVFMQRILEDPHIVMVQLTNLVDFLINLLSSFVVIIYIATLNWIVAIAIIGTILLAGLIERFRVNFRQKNRKLIHRQKEKINSLTTEIVKSEKDIKSIGLEKELEKEAKQEYDTFAKMRYNFDKKDLNIWSIRNLLNEVLSVLILVLGIYLYDLGTITLATFMIVYSNNMQLNQFVSTYGRINDLIVEVKVANERMFSLFDEYEFVTEKFGNKTIENPEGRVEFKNVSFTFRDYEYKTPERKSKSSIFKKQKLKKQKILVNETKVFENLNFKIEPNKTVAFVGRSGSGKSTILNLMSKMYECDDGQILIDGVDIKELNKETLRKTLSLVNQFPYIFDMSIKDNLKLAKEEASDEEIEEALKLASLWDFVETLPKKADTIVGESGIKLSGGQKQRLAIARAFLRKSSIIVFDESTSSLDNFAQAAVKQSIDGLKGRSTIIIVAHRLSTIKDADEIFFLEGGKIVDRGTFSELFEKNETFRTMFLTENINNNIETEHLVPSKKKNFSKKQENK